MWVFRFRISTKEDGMTEALLIGGVGETHLCAGLDAICTLFPKEDGCHQGTFHMPILLLTFYQQMFFERKDAIQASKNSPACEQWPSKVAVCTSEKKSGSELTALVEVSTG
jgi:hypothetical protein